MDGYLDNDTENKKTLEIKQVFLASAISDISTYIQLTDTKVSIIMGAVVATVLATEVLEKFSSDNLKELKEAVQQHRDYVKGF